MSAQRAHSKHIKIILMNPPARRSATKDERCGSCLLLLTASVAAWTFWLAARSADTAAAGDRSSAQPAIAVGALFLPNHMSNNNQPFRGGGQESGGTSANNGAEQQSNTEGARGNKWNATMQQSTHQATQQHTPLGGGGGWGYQGK